MLGFGLSFNTLFSTSNTIKPLAIITEEFRPSLKGGIATWAHGVATYLGVQDQYDVTVFVKKRGGLITNDIPRNVPYRLVLMYGRDWSKFKKWYISFYCKKFIKSSNNFVELYELDFGDDRGIVFHNGIYVANSDNITAYTLYTDKHSGPNLGG